METKLSSDEKTLKSQLKKLSQDSFNAQQEVTTTAEKVSEQHGFNTTDTILLKLRARDNDTTRECLEAIKAPKWETLSDDAAEEILAKLTALFTHLWDNISTMQGVINQRLALVDSPQPLIVAQAAPNQEVLSGVIIDANQEPVKHKALSPLPSHAHPSWVHQLQQLVNWMAAKLMTWKNDTFEPWAEPRRRRSDKEWRAKQAAKLAAKDQVALATVRSLAPATN